MQGGENHSLFVLLSSLHVVNIMLLYLERFLLVSSNSRESSWKSSQIVFMALCSRV